MTSRAAMPKIVAICIGLVALVWIVFGQTVGHQFVNYDDGVYVYRNFDITQGITLKQIGRIFTQSVAGNWHPLTMLTHMIDCRIYGVRPWGHHLTNTILHALSVLVLFFTLRSMTGAMWRSALVAGMFAVHPLHVESVAWIAERKDVLSGLFFMLTLAAYFWYQRRPSFGRYGSVTVLFACGLMSKPMLVTLPFVLLLADYWPLNRIRRSQIAGQKGLGAEQRSRKREQTGKGKTANLAASQRLNTSTVGALVLEKVPLFCLSAAASMIALFTQHPDRNVVNALPLISRLANAAVSIGIYLLRTFIPIDLACFYPYPSQGLPGWQITVSVAVIASLTWLAWSSREGRPYLLTGWLWFVGMLVPVLGIVQVGKQSHADRYTYLPQVGLALLVVWAVADISMRWERRHLTLGFVAVGVMVALCWIARIQTSYWHDSETLWRHALAVTAPSATVYQNLCDALLENKKTDEAIERARRALELEPNSADTNDTIGAALARKGDLNAALDYLKAALRLNPDLPRIHYNIGSVLLEKGNPADAAAEFRSDLRAEPNYPETHNNLAMALLRQGNVSEARTHIEAALKLKPDFPEARNNLAIALSQTGDVKGAIQEWNETLKLDPGNLQAECNLVWVYSTFGDPALRDGQRAVELAERALQQSNRKNSRIWRLAAAAYAEAGRFQDAITAAQSGIAVAEAEGNPGMVQTLETNIQRFQQGLPLRD